MFLFVSEKKQTSNPPQPPLVRGEAVCTSPPLNGEAERTPPLKRVKQAIRVADARIRGGREGLAFLPIAINFNHPAQFGAVEINKTKYDEARSALLRRHGLTVIRYENSDVMDNIAGIYDDLAARVF